MIMSQQTTSDTSQWAGMLEDLELAPSQSAPSNAQQSAITDLDLVSVDGSKAARPYQADGVLFALGNTLLGEGPVNCVIADQMRLGKTPQALLTLKNLKAIGKVKCPLIVVKSANFYAWVKEYKTWVDNSPMGIWTILSNHKGFVPPGFGAYIISMDSLRAKGMKKSLIAMNFDLVIADEAHSFKNLDSDRSQCLKEIVDAGGIENKLYLTGTPILNRADEYFFMLNQVAPKIFPSLHNFRNTWLEQDDKGRWSRVKPWMLIKFKEIISSYVLRREKQDVYADYPALNTTYRLVSVEDEHIKKLYNQEIERMEEKLGVKGTFTWGDIQDNLMTMRRIIGAAKVPEVVETVCEILDNSDTEKVAIGVHHKDVITLLKTKLVAKGHTPITYTGSDSAERKYDIENRLMKDPRNRVLLINSIAGGVGCDFHYINNFLVAERQWNRGVEEQFEYRFYNPDRSIKDVPTDGDYLIARGTLDEWWHNMVEEKKAVYGELVANEWDITTDISALKDLVEKTMENKL